MIDKGGQKKPPAVSKTSNLPTNANTRRTRMAGGYKPSSTGSPRFAFRKVRGHKYNY